MTTTATYERWGLRVPPAELAQRYRAEGWWNGVSLGSLLAGAVGSAPRSLFQIHSDVRPYRGTLGDVDRAARNLAESLRGRGVGVGSVVVIQLPNWAEAAISFWAATYVGAVVVPVVHFYGPKELSYIIEATSPHGRR